MNVTVLYPLSQEMLKPLDLMFLTSLSEPGSEIINLFSCSTQLSMKFTMLITVKMPTIVGILIFMSMINTTSEHLTARSLYFYAV